MTLFLAGSATIGSAANDTMPLHSGWKFRQANRNEWHPATVPGVVHTDLLDNGLIEDPYYRLNERSLQWIDKEDWIYEVSFDAGTLTRGYEHVRLEFLGLDTYADVFLNETQILTADNMFRRWAAEVKPLLKERGNVLRVYFHSPINKALPQYESLPYRYEAWNDQADNGGLDGKKLSPFTRKAGYHYGWDWGPRLVTSGIWRPVKLQGWNELRLEDVFHRQTEVSSEAARVETQVEIEAAAPVENAVVTVSDGKRVLGSRSVQLHAGMNRVSVPFTIDHPELWWCRGMGEPHLYTFRTTVELGGRVLADHSAQVGLRSVTVEKKPDAYGRSLRFLLNGEPVFCKGANYIPCDVFLPRVTRAVYEKTIDDAAAVNMNMLRVWGGGTYESDDFYEMCDRYGIMVWQDFVFACNMYPGSAQIYADIRAEAEDNVRRLRNHPSLVLWCGNNEIDVAWKPHDKRNSRFRKFYTEEEAEQFDRVNETIFRNILPGVVDSLCGGTVPYWHSSPSPGWGLDTADRWRYGDVHNWDVWHKGDPISAYNTQIARFTSEYGLQSYPELSSVERFIPEGERRLASPAMKSHQGDQKKGDARMLEYVDRSYLRDGDFARTLYLSQLMQAEGMKTAMEAHRRNMPYCMGSLIWQLNDVWPCASWSGIDYYGRWKAMHYFVKKACEPVVVSPYIQGDTLDIFVVSDLRKPLRGVMKLTLTDFSGNELKSSSHPVTVGAAASQRALRYGVRDYLDGADPGNAVLVCEFRSDKTAYRALQYFETMKNAALPAAAVRIRAEKPDAATCRITVSSDKLAKNLTLHYKGTAGIFSDNYFDLLPGESRSVTLTAPEDAAEILRHIECMALNPETTIIKL